MAEEVGGRGETADERGGSPPPTSITQPTASASTRQGRGVLGSSPSQTTGRDVLLALQEAVLVVDGDGGVVLFNSAAEALWGWRADEVTGRPVGSLLGPGVDLTQARHQRLRTKNKAGDELFLRISVREVLLAVSDNGGTPHTVRRVLVEDVSEDAEYLQLNAIVDLARFPVVACSSEGEIMKFNKAAAQVFGVAQADALGVDVLRLFASGAASKLPAAEVLEAYVGSGGTEETGVRLDGSTFPMRLSVSKVEATDYSIFTLIMEDMTTEVASKESLQAEQRKTASIVNSALNAIITTDCRGAIELINISACRIFGVGQHDVGNLASLLLLEDGSQPSEDSMGDYLHGASGTVVELQGRRTDGSTFPLRMSVSKVDSEGNHLFTVILRDVTKEKESHAAVAAEQRKTAAIMNSALNAIITTDSEGRFELVNTSACRIFGLIQGQTDGKRMSSLILLEDGTHPPEESMGLYLHTAAGTVRELQGCRADGSTFPMRMSVSEVDSEGQHLFTAILRDITKEKEDLARVEQEQRKTAAIMNSALNAIITTDNTGRFELVNTSACRIFGLTQGQTDGKSMASLIALDDGSHPPEDSMGQYLHEAAGTVRELQGCRVDGSTFPMRMSVSEVDSEGQHLFTAILRDITKEKQHNAQVEREQRKTAAIMNSALNAIITTDKTGRFELVNTSACRIFGLIQGETDGKSMASLIALDDGSHPPEDSMGQYLHEAAGTVRELQGCRVGGSTFPMRMSISEVDSEGQHLFTAILRDITKEKEHQARVAAEERKTAAIMNSALNAIITTDNKGRFELVNTSACRVFGLVPGQTDGKSIASLILLDDGSHPPEDNMGQYLADMAGEVREVEGCGADGSSFPMRMSVSEVNCDGQHLFTAILRDITKEKEDAARLIAANQVIKLERSKLQALLDSTVEGFIVINSVGLIESFNKSAIKIFGYTPDEIVGCNVSVLMNNKIARRHNRYLKRYITKGEGGSVVGHAREVTAKKKNGQEFQILLSISDTVVNGQHYFTATVRDLSNELLLLNMLPLSIAARLKEADGPINDGHEIVSILFADICGFTALSSALSPFQVVSFLNDIFRDFDELADIYQLEKIKTIGDCYMVVSGVPEACEQHALKLACFAIEMRQALLRYNEHSDLKQPLSMRIGMHCGPVIAGVVGKRKFLYDIWGDAVNVASRMESTGTPGEIQVSNDIKELLSEWFEFDDRGMTAVKGKGDMHTWMLKDPKVDTEESLMELICDTLAGRTSGGSATSSTFSMIADVAPKLGPIFEELARKHFPEDYKPPEAQRSSDSVTSATTDYDASNSITDIPITGVDSTGTPAAAPKTKKVVMYGLPSLEADRGVNEGGNTGRSCYSTASATAESTQSFRGDSIVDGLTPRQESSKTGLSESLQSHQEGESGSGGGEILLLPGQLPASTIPELMSTSEPAEHVGGSGTERTTPENLQAERPTRRCALM